jgi:LmbE family N-acetylglucosaminyl deacetylase
MSGTALGLFAHPDDAEFMCAGTLALLRKSGWEVHIATMARGDCGSAVLDREEISGIRQTEAKKSVKLLQGTYHCLGFDDVFILYERESLKAAIELLRRIRPVVVFTHSPSDYMVDHEVTSKITQTACFAAGMRNIETGNSGIYETVPYLYYSDAMEGKDIYGKPVEPSIWIDIGTVFDIKEKMLACHKSQREWLLQHHNIDEYILSMKRFAAERGRKKNLDFAEVFRQHLGHGFPQDNLLRKVLGGHAVE